MASYQDDYINFKVFADIQPVELEEKIQTFVDDDGTGDPEHPDFRFPDQEIRIHDMKIAIDPGGLATVILMYKLVDLINR